MSGPIRWGGVRAGLSVEQRTKATPSITITFDQVIDTTTLDEFTFSLTFPGARPDHRRQSPDFRRSRTSTVPVTGTWSFTTNAGNQTVATFTPANPLQQNAVFTAMLLGSNAALTSSVIKNPAGESMAVSYSWGFTTVSAFYATSIRRNECIGLKSIVRKLGCSGSLTLAALPVW